MWFKRKSKNRKLNKELVLDVKLRTDAVRAGRIRVVGRLLTLLFGAVAAAFVAWRGGGWALNRLVYQNPAMTIDTIEAHSDGVVPPEQIRRWAGVQTGENLLALDLQRIRRNLQMVPSVYSVGVKRVFPRKLQIEIVEREPVAQVHVLTRTTNGLESVRYLVDAQCCVMHPGDFGAGAQGILAGMDNFPVILGVPVESICPGIPVDFGKLKSALSLLEMFDRSDLVGLVDITTVDLSQPEVMVVRTSQGSSVTLSTAQVPEQLRRWRLIQAQAQFSNKAIATLDLSITNNNPALWIEASLAPTPSKKSNKILRTKRKHV